MTRRTRPAALLSAAALLAGAGLSLALAPSAAAVDAPPLGTLSASPSAPVAGDLVSISGDGCLAVPVLPSAAAATPAAVAPAAAPAAPAAPADETPGSVSITITGPDSFESHDSATASPDGTWDGDQGITVGDAGTYTVDATCTLASVGTGTGAAPAAAVGFDYASLTLEVAAPPQVVDPSIVCTGCDSATPGSQVTLVGTQFPASTTATVSLAGYPDVTREIDDQGGFSGAAFTIATTEGSGTLDGTVSAPGADPVPFTVTVTAPTPTTPTSPPPPAVDGTVPTSTDTSGTGDANGTGSTDGTDGTDGTDTTGGTNYTSSAPTLPNTGIDSVWPGVIGGLLVLAGGGLLWAGRRRDDAARTAV